MSENRSELFEEVRLYRTAREREHYDSMADLYSVINTLNCLEKAYIKDSVTAKEYTAACSKLLVQYNVAFSQVKSDEFPTIESFMNKFCFECTAALKRIHDGRPITIKDDKGNAQKCIADIVSLFITITDRLRLDIKSMDEVTRLITWYYIVLINILSFLASTRPKRSIRDHESPDSCATKL